MPITLCCIAYNEGISHTYSWRTTPRIVFMGTLLRPSTIGTFSAIEALSADLRRAAAVNHAGAMVLRIVIRDP